MDVRAVLDTGSQQSYASERVRKTLAGVTLAQEFAQRVCFDKKSVFHGRAHTHICLTALLELEMPSGPPTQTEAKSRCYV